MRGFRTCQLLSPFLPALLFLSLSSPFPAAAQPGVPVIPPQGSPIPQIRPSTPPRVGPGTETPAAPGIPAAALAGNVAIRRAVVEGATAFPAADLLARGNVPLTGAAVPVANLETARAAILGLYREQGYVFTTVDAVVDRDGTLRLVVGEGSITDVQLDGDIGPAGTQLLRFLNHLVGQRPLDVATLERWLLIAQDMPGISLRTVLRPSGTAPGALTLVARVSRRAVGGYLTVDNRAFRLTGPEQALAVLQLNSFTELAERTELSFFYGTHDTQLFGQASTEFYVGDSGLKVRLYAGRGRARPSGVLRAIDYEGTTTVAGISASYPLLRRRTHSLNLTAAFDAIDSEIEVDGGAGQVRLSHDALRVLRVGAEGAVYDLLLGDTRPASNTAVLRLSQGISAFGATARDNPNAGRAGSDPGFTAISFDLTRTQTLFQPWEGATLALQASLAGQWSNDVLPLSEKFFLGGGRLGRGFYAGEVSGDRAIAASVELQLGTSFERTIFGQSFTFAPMTYVFYDWGRTYESQSIDPDRHIASYGIGVRVPVNDFLEFQVEGVRRVTRRPNGDQAPALHADAIYWRVLTRF
ncbi:MAG TPA: ShlB/FhaC/HecB family hemolysin secretion/activation protein [Roseomonas sp.]|jgi:hemolysin activation/secretion protein